MNKNTIHDQKHLTLTDRTYIEQELFQGSSFKSIGSALHKDPATISKEIRKHVKAVDAKHYSNHCVRCKHYSTCDIHGEDICVSDCKRAKYCKGLCKKCWKEHPPRFCSLYAPFLCNRTNKAPYVCNSCLDEKNCPLAHRIYRANHAQQAYEKTLVKSLEGINLTPEELQKLNDLVSPLILKGQPLSHIFAVHADEIPVCRRTVYNYLEQRIFQARNIELPRRVRYKKRKKKDHSFKTSSKSPYRRFFNSQTEFTFSFDRKFLTV